MTNTSHKSKKFHLKYSKILTGAILAASLAVVSMPAAAQQAGTVNGHVTSSDGSALSGVTVEARSPNLPGVRTATSSANGRYQLPLLPPGQYELTFKNSDGTVIKRQAAVLLQQKIKVDVAFAAVSDEIIVIGQKIEVDTGQATLKATIGSEAINSVPTGQEYRDLIKLIPGVQYTEDVTRGPSAGGNGQDNVYQFDGVDVSTPLFGTLSNAPSSHDIDQVSIVRGGASAVGFNRSGGFKVNTISKRGTNELHGEIGYKLQASGFSADRNDAANVDFKRDQQWITASLGGPILKDKLFAYASYYRPTITDSERVNNAGEAIADRKVTRDEYFGKLTFAPTDGLLLDLSYRTSESNAINEGLNGFAIAPTASTGTTTTFDILTAEGSWVISDNSALSFKVTDFQNKNAGRPDNLLDIPIQLGNSLNIGALETQGRFRVPVLRTGMSPEDLAFNAAAQPLINQYGFSDNGVQTGGGVVGVGSTINNQDFERQSYEIAFDHTIYAGDTSHDIHIGYQYQENAEDLNRFGNGYGDISFIGGTTLAADGTPIFYRANLGQQNIVDQNGNSVAPPNIRSAARLQSFEINDTIENGDWTFNIGVLISNDKLFGQGLRENPNNQSGFELAPGNRYLMHETKWADLIQPRFGVAWDYSDRDNVYANFARYNPAATSLSRAASWDRRLARSIDIEFDVNGNFIGIDPVRSSSGKLFQAGIKPRFVNEYLVGWNRIVNDNLSLKMHARYREGGNFWEDTPNDARIGELIRGGGGARFPSLAPTEIQDLGLYIPQLDQFNTEISGGSYVIAQLDTAHTDYYEAGIEADYTGSNFYVNASYTWSRYTGNFDQDNISSNNDRNLFIGSSSFADGVGRNVWNNRQGTLRGDRPHQFKLFGYYDLPWNGRVGVYSIFQSGQPWERWSNAPYRDFTRSRSSFLRFSEPAGSNRTDSHFQLDLNYTQTFEVWNGKTVELRADIYNVFNTQTGYNIQPRDDRGGFEEPRSFFNPRRLQLTAKAKF